MSCVRCISQAHVRNRLAVRLRAGKSTDAERGAEMPVDLTKPLAWKSATGDAGAMLSQLQPNILKGHVREHMQVLLVQFSDEAEGRAFLRAVALKMKSAKKHLLEVERFNSPAKTPGTRYIGVGITRAGYAKIGIPAAKVPGSAKPSASPFRASMRSDGSVATLS